MTFGNFMLFLVKLLAGIGVFLVGVHLLTNNIEQLATGKIKSLFGKTANRRLLNVGIGTVATALIQSSSVTTVLIVGFVNVGIINLLQATAMIMGANIGTTITAQIAALSALPVTTYIQLSVFIGIMMSMTCKSDNLKKTGSILAGLGLIFIGLSLMSDTMKTNRDAVQGIFEVVTNPFLLFGLGVFLTAIVQSSSAVTSIIIAMSVAGLTIGTGGNEVLYIILGTNIGSCGTAVMSSLTAGTNARRAGLIHLLFNTVGAAIFLVLLLCWPGFMASTFQKWFPTAATQIAMFHTFFNVTCTLLFLPFCKVFVKVSELLIPEKKAEPVQTFLDERMLTSASLAVSQLEKELVLLSDTAMDAFRMSYKSFKTKDKALIAPTQSLIEQAGNTSQSIINYLIRLAPQSKLLYERNISDLHNNVGDVMRIAEIADNFTKYTQRAIDKNLQFSSPVQTEIDGMVSRIEDLYALTKQIILEKDASLLPQIDEAENDVDAYRKKLIDGHVARLNAGECKPESIGVFINLVSNLERLGDHLTYIAYTAKA
ncbi:MAG: Na/Pi cotransporter family protein [Oscillospiraceae bacterium]|nr:Na/Pi cotransporter family protein [Oscillospiraceae bacterium]